VGSSDTDSSVASRLGFFLCSRLLSAYLAGHSSRSAIGLDNYWAKTTRLSAASKYLFLFSLQRLKNLRLLRISFSRTCNVLRGSVVGKNVYLTGFKKIFKNRSSASCLIGGMLARADQIWSVVQPLVLIMQRLELRLIVMNRVFGFYRVLGRGLKV